ncbi:hypothetical protein PV409_36350 [Streptomyces sp. ME02-6979.5a]|uniref:hypothetical protein n=1 Tax=Streptomyces sp. ME02-6979.5a TaxID=462925 RepID=UPI0029B649C9|nr:hypothetical protein [Streptomyces sp. ME02-6979.5a]MDX3343433.1 hypothetical protein [Streptomyces sp. ME02-6979.5a]
MALNWRDVTTLELNEKLIPDPNAAHNKLDRLQNVRVAVEGGFLHIDPRKDSGSGQDLFMVPASAVRRVVYREPAAAEPFMVEVQTG